jgi:hypothetical protein
MMRGPAGGLGVESAEPKFRDRVRRQRHRLRGPDCARSNPEFQFRKQRALDPIRASTKRLIRSPVTANVFRIAPDGL